MTVPTDRVDIKAILADPAQREALIQRVTSVLMFIRDETHAVRDEALMATHPKHAVPPTPTVEVTGTEARHTTGHDLEAVGTPIATYRRPRGTRPIHDPDGEPRALPDPDRFIDPDEG